MSLWPPNSTFSIALDYADRDEDEGEGRGRVRRRGGWGWQQRDGAAQAAARICQDTEATGWNHQVCCACICTGAIILDLKVCVGGGERNVQGRIERQRQGKTHRREMIDIRMQPCALGERLGWGWGWGWGGVGWVGSGMNPPCPNWQVGCLQAPRLHAVPGFMLFQTATKDTELGRLQVHRAGEAVPL